MVLEYAENSKYLVYRYLILCSACVPSNKIAESGRFDGKLCYLSVTCPKCFDLHLRHLFSVRCIEFPHNK